MTGEEFQTSLAARVAAAGHLPLSASLGERLEAYYRLLATWNKRINLTAFDLASLPAEAVDRLFVEPLAAARHASQHCRVLDVGSGGGSPAIPFALAADASSLTMVESRMRKSVFLREAARAVALEAEVVTARFSEAAESDKFAEAFDFVTIRAVRIDNDDWHHLRTVLRLGGSAFLMHQADPGSLKPDGFKAAGPFTLTEKAQLSTFTRC